MKTSTNSAWAFLRIIATLARWRDIVGYGVLGGLVAGIVLPRTTDSIAERTGSPSYASADVLLLIAAAVGVFTLHALAGVRLSHLRQILRYPPLPLAVTIGVAVFIVITAGWDWQLIAAVEGLYLSLWIGHALVVALGTRTVNVLRARSNRRYSRKTDAHNDDKLYAWIKDDEPVDNPSADLFNHALIAERIVRRLATGDATIALQGNFGAGKSSIGRIAEHLAASKGLPLVFAYVSSWGFGESLDAQEELLSRVLERVARHVDTSAVRSLPAEYVGSVSSGAGWYGALLRLITGMRGPKRVLGKMAPILAAINKRVVLFVEDADRNFPSFDLTQLEALLARLRDVPGLSFVLCISPTSKIDLPKLCDRTEIIPALDQREVLRLIHQTRDFLLRKNPVDVMLDPLSALLDAKENSLRLEGYLGYFWPRQYTLPNLADSPRVLKRALRRVVEAWPELCGEVNIDDLIDISVLREGAPEAFHFFQRRYALFRPAAKNHHDIRDEAKTKLKESLVAEWKQICSTGSFDTRSAAWLMKDLFPASGGITGLTNAYTTRRQSMHSERRREVYATRLFTESPFGDEISDQQLFRLLRDARTQDGALAQLAAAITDSKFASDAFEEFAGALEFDRFLPLLSQVYATIRHRHGPRVSRDDHPGFFAPWRSVNLDRPPGFEEWLVGELRKCVPSHLRLLTDIYYFWLGTDRHNSEERVASRKAINDALKDAWTTMEASDLPAGFDPSWPYTLFHLFFTSDYKEPDTVPLNKIEDWSWTAGPLRRAAELCPSIILPQIIWILNGAPDRGLEVPRFSLDEKLLVRWFGMYSRDIVTLIAKGFEIHQEIDSRERYVLTQAIDAIRTVQSS